jgi:hypothetical protein
VTTADHASALATSSGSLTIQPRVPGKSSLFYRTTRGETARGSFLVRNPTARRQRVTLYGLDASVDRRSKVFSVGAKNAPQTAVGSWLRLGSSTVVLNRNGKRRIGFTLSIPEVAKPGRYAGAIVAEGPPARPPSARSAPGGREDLLIVERVGLRVYLDVPASSAADLALAGPRIEKSRWTIPGSLRLLGVRRGRRVSLAARLSNSSEHPRRDLTVHAEVLRKGTLVSSTEPQPVGLVSAHEARDVHVAVSYAGWSRHGYRGRIVVRSPGQDLVSERILQPAWSLEPLNLAAAVTVLVCLLLIARRFFLRGRHLRPARARIP